MIGKKVKIEKCFGKKPKKKVKKIMEKNSPMVKYARLTNVMEKSQANIRYKNAVLNMLGWVKICQVEKNLIKKS